MTSRNESSLLNFVEQKTVFSTRTGQKTVLYAWFGTKNSPNCFLSMCDEKKLFFVQNAIKKLFLVARSVHCCCIKLIRSDPRLQIAKIYKYKILQQNAIIAPVSLWDFQ